MVGLERKVQMQWCKQRLKGEMEVCTEIGRADIIDTQYVYEVKDIKLWTHAFAQVLLYAKELKLLPAVILYYYLDLRNIQNLYLHNSLDYYLSHTHDVHYKLRKKILKKSEEYGIKVLYQAVVKVSDYGWVNIINKELQDQVILVY